MFLSRLHLRNFRNYAEQVLEFPSGGVAIVGDNGQGKTNLLEAIYYLEIFRSFRGSADEQLVRFGESVFRVAGQVRTSDGTERAVAAAYDRSGRRKKVSVDEAEIARLSDALGIVGAVIFSPSDVALVSGSPGTRRRFIDIVLSLAVPGYLEALQQFRQAVTRRNALLRQGAAANVTGAFNEGLAGPGSRIMAARAAWVAERQEAFAEHSAAIAGGPASQIGYAPSLALEADRPDGDSGRAKEEIADFYRSELERTIERDQRRGMTMIGPHRDDLKITSTGGGPDDNVLDLRIYGSGGQQRTAAVALRMTEADTLHDTRDRQPIILLDDVFAELDPGRARRILAWVDARRSTQVILTAPKATDFEVRSGELPRWRIRDGVVTPL